MSQGPERSVDRPAIGVRGEDPGQVIGHGKKRRTAQQIVQRPGPVASCRERGQGSADDHRQAQHDDQPRKQAQAPRREKHPGRSAAVIALCDEIARDCEEHDHRHRAERLSRKQSFQRLDRVRPQRNRKGMRHKDRERGDKTQQVEMVHPPRGSGAKTVPPLCRTGHVAVSLNISARRWRSRLRWSS